MGYYRERPGSGRLPKREELLASIRDGSFLANHQSTTMRQKKADWEEYCAQCLVDKVLFVGPPTRFEVEYRRRFTDQPVTENKPWDDRYDSLGRHHTDWHD